MLQLELSKVSKKAYLTGGLRLKPSFADFLVYAASTAIYGTVLTCHDGFDCRFILDVPRETRDFWNDDNNLDSSG